MSETKNLATLIIILAVIFGLIGALVSYDLQQYNSKIGKSVKGGDESLIEVKSDDISTNTRVMVTDRFVGKLDKNSKVVAIGDDGSMYVVRGGTVLASDMVVGTNEDTTSVYRINDPEKSVSN